MTTLVRYLFLVQFFLAYLPIVFLAYHFRLALCTMIRTPYFAGCVLEGVSRRSADSVRVMQGAVNTVSNDFSEAATFGGCEVDPYVTLLRRSTQVEFTGGDGDEVYDLGHHVVPVASLELESTTKEIDDDNKTTDEISCVALASDVGNISPSGSAKTLHTGETTSLA